MNLINLAHGSFVLVGAYLTIVMNEALGIDPFLALPGTAVALFAFGFLLQRYLINRIVERSIFTTLIFTFGLNMLIVNVLLVVFTAYIRGITLPYALSGCDIGGVRIPYGRAAVFV